MADAVLEYVSIGRDDGALTLDGDPQYVAGGAMIGHVLDRRWVGSSGGSYWEYFVATPAHDGRHQANLGAGDDVVAISSGDDDFAGGAGFDMLDFGANTFDPGASYNWDYALPYPRYFATVNLATGIASWEGRDVSETVSSIVTVDGEGVDTISWTFSIADWGSYRTSFRNFEAVRGSQGDDRITGSDAPLELYDLSRNGRDTVDGAGGIDWVTYGRFEGTLFQDDRTAVRLDLAAGTALTSGDYYENYATRTSRLSGIENVLGSASADVIRGDKEDNMLCGGLGNDTLDGRGGVDTLVTEFSMTDGYDHLLDPGWVAYYGARTEPDRGVEVDLKAGRAYEADGTRSQTDVISNFENVIGTARNDTITGDGGDNRLEGGAGDDRLSGGAGRDTLEGGDGVDNLAGGGGADVFIISPGTGVDRITDFAFGTDTLKIATAGPQPAGMEMGAMIKIGGLPVQLMAGLRGFMNTKGDDIEVSGADKSPIVNLVGGVSALVGHIADVILKPTEGNIGTSGADRMTGTAKADKMAALDGDDRVVGLGGDDDISGGAGADRLEGGAGNDLLSGDAGADVLIGGFGNDRLTGGDGDDRLVGEIGADTLEGGAGSDTLIGGIGGDRFIITNAAGLDRIQDYGTGDRIDISAFAQLGLRPNRAALSIEWADEANRIAVVSLDDPLSARDIALFEIELGARQNLEGFLKTADFTFSGGLAPIFAKLNAALVEGSGKINQIIGTVGRDVMRGLGGDDILEGRGGHDRLSGDAGDDQISGGAGNDSLSGGAGNDKLMGDSGNDTLDGGGGFDMLIGSITRSLLRGGAGNDTLVANGGTTTMIGGAGADTFVLNRDALENGEVELQDFDPAEDRLMIDPALNLQDSLLRIRNNLIQIDMVSDQLKTDSVLRFEVWEDILNQL